MTSTMLIRDKTLSKKDWESLLPIYWISGNIIFCNHRNTETANYHAVYTYTTKAQYPHIGEYLIADFIVHHEGRYNVFLTDVNDFGFEPSLSLDELTEYIRKTYWENGVKGLQEWLDRAHATGTSERHPGSNLDSHISCNRTGVNEARLSREECISRFLSNPNTSQST